MTEAARGQGPRPDALASLFPRATERGEVLEHWADGRFLVEHGAPKDLEDLVAERFPTPEALADAVPDLEMSVYGFREAGQAEGVAVATDGVADLHTFPPTTVRDSVALYHAGHTVICWRMLDHLPEALRRGSDILEEIGLPHRPMAARGLTEPWSNRWRFIVSLAYSPAGAGSGLGMHFDLFDSVVVQLRGRKRWRVGRHPHLEYPIYNEDSGAKLDYPPSLSRLATHPEFVGELETVEMRRGSVLLLPRGTYHTTLADDEASLSIGYHFSLPTWSHVLLAALERRLTRDPRMRTTPFGAFYLAGPSRGARDRMAWAAEQVRAALDDPQRLLEADLLGNLASRHQAAFRLVPEARARLTLGDPPSIADFGGQGVDIQLPAEARDLCGWLLGNAGEWFDVDDALLGADGRLSEPDAWNLLQECVEAGLLERRWGRPGEHGASD